MKLHVVSLFPEMITQACAHSILGRAQAAGHIYVNCIDIRDFAVNRHGQVDDAPYGGGAGMVLMAQPVYDAVMSISAPEGTPVIYLTPAGEIFTQKKAREMAREYSEIILICGHYEGLDRRVIEEIVTHEISVGDYILTGGEIAALAVIDAVARLVPGVLGKAESHQNESFSGKFEEMIEHPHYTRPPVWRGKEVPPILMSGHHGEIEKFRMQQAIEKTTARAKQSVEAADSPDPAPPLPLGT